MKKNLYQIGMLAAAAVAFVSCKSEIDITTQNEITHYATVSVGKPEATKTAVVEGENSASYIWNENDAQYFCVTENGVKGQIQTFELSDDKKTLTLTVGFPGTPEAPYTYEAKYAKAFTQSSPYDPIHPAEQTPLANTYDPAADVLVSKKITSADSRLGKLIFTMGRVVTVNKMTLTGLEKGEVISKVEFTLDKTVNGDSSISYNDETGISTFTGTNKLTFNYDSTTGVVPDGGKFPVYFTAAPVEAAPIVSVVVTTDMNVYRKSTSCIPDPFDGKTISFTVGAMKRFSMDLSAYLGNLIDDGEGIAIDLCESKKGWQTGGELVLDTENKTQGGASLSTTLTKGDQTQIIFQKPFETPVDASSIDYDKAVLSMDVWFEDVTKLNLGNIEASQFEIGSNENPDKEEVSWPMSEWNIKNGWNHIELRFKGAKTNDQINMAQIKRIRWYHDASIGSTTIKIDNIRIIEREFTKPSDPDAVYIHHCDNADNWNVNFSVDYLNHQEGDGCLSTTVGGDFVWSLNLTEAINCSSSSFSKESAVLAFDIYVSSAAGMKFGVGDDQVELSSTFKDDEKEYSWRLSQVNLTDGWNHLELPLKDAGVTDGEPDMSQINHIRIYHVGWTSAAEGNVTVKLDNIRIR